MVPNQPNPKFLKTYWYGLILKIQQSVKPCLPPSSDGPEAWACWLSISSWMALLMSTQESIKNTKQIVWKCTQAFQFYSNIVINQIIYLCTSFVQCTYKGLHYIRSAFSSPCFPVFFLVISKLLCPKSEKIGKNIWFYGQ